ncbi:hypothetical protein A1Q1_02808 [Trichosporon asahii var. asahii CBS 2479]|uniref:Uncharacterized protein n=1 Tax=Trichosporon asahii var. asahii (strain ATCC 90039 / CBS 2479 / JCM 2466 / KCTC 7840 / NBRC 103889/ NCYC 2677 / UAMH 7654) TaxID=1186058 RepID=J6EZE1_TRIAS|nr:hypothetical protein A1Q1_02808 [Trichosporon asahii var. asahii CBS 2479]EJT48242.1 hypothetical protein A1Q1_02808 [Trichosporon asahii var. asahii CBS 2479]
MSHVEDLKAAVQVMERVTESIRQFDTYSFTYIPPVIDNSSGTVWKGDETHGLRKFLEKIFLDETAFSQMLADGVNPRESPLPIALGHQTYWNTITHARGPIPAIRATFKGPDKKEAFVDVVAQGGAEWIRLFSKKPSHLIAEFREQDSYINSDWESDEDSGCEPDKEPSLDNSIIRTVDELLEVMHAQTPAPGGIIPRLTLRLSRIEEFPEGGHPDPRFAATFAAVRAKGVNLVFGDLSDVSGAAGALPATPTTFESLKPTRRINLDPTALMGLCSDILHHPLPVDDEEARRRFYRPEHLLGSDGQQSQNSRELYRAMCDEMIQPVVETLQAMLDGDNVEFWATRGSITYLQEAISDSEEAGVFGEGMEQRRMRRLTGLEEGDFWEGSRYEGKAGVLANMKLHVFDEDDKDLEHPLVKHTTSFHGSLGAMCTDLVSQYRKSLADSKAARKLPAFLQAKRLPAPRVAKITTPFTVVSLESFAYGAREGMTTMTMSHIVFRELWGQRSWKEKGWSQSNYELEDSAPASDPRAVVWMLPYRSLAEAKRCRFLKGDYSYPVFVQRIVRDENGRRIPLPPGTRNLDDIPQAGAAPTSAAQ